ncbi:MAG: 23S rRNA (pseudouridine(1915)-N(3))-methyltransferase RlmH [Bacteroidetes bacterium]|jgi:23S rRNA (pseudouridine1915-N3)-methyltransferase|nr:23S rRNA (pseudouridine(1915)-N(3))-methyltransferase RlmH [Bacteroidota bacterium]
MKIQILATGITTEKYLQNGMEAYYKRLTPMLSINYEEIVTGRQSKKSNTALVKKQEAELQLKKVQSNDFLVLLDEKGKQMTSVQFSGYLQDHFNKTAHNLIFLMGGAYGFDESVYRRANQIISVSSMTFTHQMIRLLFMEQLYRAMTILKGLPYHHN